MRYDSVYRRTCNGNINDTARGQSLQPLYFNARPLNRDHYWPNNGDSYPEHFYVSTPPYVFHMHIHRDAVVTVGGNFIFKIDNIIFSDTSTVPAVNRGNIRESPDRISKIY